jgi:hypothetical protein
MHDTSLLDNEKQPPQGMKDKHEYRQIQQLVTRVGMTINNDHQELLNNGLNKKNKPLMAAVSGHAGISISHP